jgi:hypothetical protein
MRDKARLLQETDEAFNELRQAIDGLDDGRLTRVWLGTWSIREILIHISGWHAEMIPALARVARGEAPYASGAYDDFDAWNARFVEARHGVKVSDVLAELDTSHRDFVRAADAVPEARLADARALIEGTGSGHYREHTAQIRAWRAQDVV